MTYRISGGYLNYKGTMIQSKYDRLTLRVNSTFHPTSNVKIGENISFTKGKRYGGQYQAGVNSNMVISALVMDPTLPVKDKNGYTTARHSDASNPVLRANLITSNHPISTWGTIGNIYVRYNPTKGLSFKTNLDVGLNLNDNKSFNPQYDFSSRARNPVPSVSHTKSMGFHWTWDNTITYQTDLNTNNNIKILIGVSQENFTYNFLSGSNQGQPGNAPNLRYLDAGVSSPQVGGRESQWALLSEFSRLNYNFKQTYFLTFSYRRDASSKFGPHNRSGNFPAASGGWVLTNEPFFPKGNILEYLKLRGSWGIAGNQQSVDYYEYASLISNTYYTFGTSGATSVASAPSGFGNPSLHWEKLYQWDVGLDYHLFNDRITGSFDYFNKTTKDMLLSVPILSESGFSKSPPRNIASMRNSGFEFAVNYQQTLNKNLVFNTGLNFSTLHNKVLSLKQKGGKIVSGFLKPGTIERTEAGHHVASFYGYVANGIFQTKQQVKSHATQSGAAPGDIRFKDLNGDGIINDEDRTFLGTPIPKATYGFHVGGNYKDFDWKLSFSGVYGNKIFSAYRYRTWGLFISGYNMGKEALNRWHGKGTSHTIPRLDAADPNNNARISSLYLQDGSYLRLRNIILGYTLPHTLLQRINMQKIRIYISAENVFTFTRYTGYDPELGTQSHGVPRTGNLQAAVFSPLSLGIDNGTYPQSRTISLGINLSF